MKQLAYFCLEGLRTQGPHRVWITLGIFPSQALADGAAVDPTIFKPDVIQTRIIAVYRDSGHTGLAMNHSTKTAQPESANSVTVA